MTNEVFKKLDSIRNENESNITEFNKTIIENTFNDVISIINKNLAVPLEGFLIRGMTPYFNDGEECVHSSDFALHSISLDNNFDYELLERCDMFEIIFKDYDFYKDKDNDISDSWDYKQEIKSGKMQPILPCSSLEELEIINHGVYIIGELIEKLMITNYIAVAKLQDDGNYTFTYEHFEPDY